MTANQIKQVVHDYEKIFSKVTAKTFAADAHPSPEEKKQHIAHMLLQIDYMVETGKLEKAFRWLGFIQGYLWSNDMSTIPDLKKSNQ